MSETTFEATSVEAALEKAASAMGVKPDELEHEVVEKKQDFWGTGDDTFVIKAWKRPSDDAGPAERKAEPAEEKAEPAEEKAEPAEEKAEPAEEKPEPAREAAAGDAEEAVGIEGGEDEGAEEGASEPQSARAGADDEAARDKKYEPTAPPQKYGGETAETDTDVRTGEINAMLAQIFHDMEFECTVEVEAEEEGYLATIAGADKEAILEGNGRCLSALELLVNNAFRNRMPRGTKIRVDAGDFRSRRDQELTDLAYQVAHSAKESGKTQETQPLNPYERRLVHLALAEDPAVTTRSRGGGFLKNVQIIPQSGGRGRGRRR